MMFKSNAVAGMVLVSWCILVSGCSEKRAVGEVRMQRDQVNAPAAGVPNMAQKKPMTAQRKASEESRMPMAKACFAADNSYQSMPDLKTVFTPLTMVAKDRYLSYSMELTYACDEFLDARTQLISLIPRFGFILTCETEITDYSSSLNAAFKIRSDSLFEFISALREVGYLQHESINGVDYTGDVFLNSLQVTRQKQQLARKTDVVYSTAVHARSFENREQNLSDQENQLDQKEFERWQFDDRIAWVEVKIHLNGPRKVYQEKTSIVVPGYKKAVYRVISDLLGISVFCIYAIPYVLVLVCIGWAVVVIRRKIKKTVSKNAD